MNKNNKKLNIFTSGIILGIEILIILAIFLFSPLVVKAYTTTPYSSFGSGNGSDGGYYSGGYYGGGSNYSNPTPSINSLSPNSSNLGNGTKTIIITGEDFVPNSVARVNNYSRPITFIDPSHVLVQITGNDLYAYRTNGGFFITVWNPGPGGGYSNGKFFTINNKVASTAKKSSNGNIVAGTNVDKSANNNFIDINEIENGSANTLGNLASNAIFGGSGFMPNGILQWILVAILILIIIILARKALGGEKRYHATPLKQA